jgi:hypothetical protein
MYLHVNSKKTNDRTAFYSNLKISGIGACKSLHRATLIFPGINYCTSFIGKQLGTNKNVNRKMLVFVCKRLEMWGREEKRDGEIE